MKFSTLDDLGIVYDDWNTNPPAFLDRLYKAGMILVAELDSSKTSSDIRNDFIDKALKQTEPAEKARSLVDAFLNQVLAESPETVANVVSLLNVVKLSLDEVLVRNLPNHLHKYEYFQLYVKLRNTYEAYTNFMRNFEPEKMPKIVKQLPQKNGNYKPKSGSYVLFHYYIDGNMDDPFVLPLQVARLVGLPNIKTRMDLHDAIREGKTTRVTIEEY